MPLVSAWNYLQPIICQSQGLRIISQLFGGNVCVEADRHQKTAQNSYLTQ